MWSHLPKPPLPVGSSVFSEAPRAPARGICGEAKRNSAEATRLRLTGYAAVACRHFIGPKPSAKADPLRVSTQGILAKASNDLLPQLNNSVEIELTWSAKSPL